ncbi:sodium/hydrogen exchanger [Epithele typhae]|uniref:sodium/hydrogen exchanger n=1 Tax=Epithele typhae TaxID=378194 RepID=UPI0020072D26|nr:sodium/hydrogen exchanger [Epithele typhae]KAH9931608.1 sodium/hydrogen exchanger [Epithele typhae]
MASDYIPTRVFLAAEPTESATIPEEEEYYSSWSLFLVCMLLVISLWTSYYLQIKRIRAIHETLVAIGAGMVVGLVVRLAPGTEIRGMLTFKHTLFFNLLLPPIILNSGYELKQENFFRNFGSILVFAFLGTFISAVGVGIIVFIWSSLGLESLGLSLIECLIFGSTLSATDPVTILAIFNQYKVDPKLYTVIFGESLLNDAVSIVMYETLSQFHGSDFSVSHLFHGTGIFLLSFGISMALGVVFGLAMSLLLKHSSLSLYPSIETCLVALCAYMCYFFSNGISKSGIVSLLFCGITLKHYAYHTMSRRTQRATKYIFSTLAQLSENFIFIYLGLSLFTSPPSSAKVTSYVKPLFIIVTTVAVVFTRYAAVFPLSEMINLFHRHARGQRQEELPHSYQMMLFWAGLRGAVGVALAAGFQGENAESMRTTVLVVVVLTVVVFGGTTARMLEVLGIRTGVEDDEAGSSDEEEDIRSQFFRRTGRWSRIPEDDAGYFSEHSRTRRGVGVGLQPPLATHALQRPAAQSNTLFSAASSDSYDSDGGEVLPLAPAATDSPRRKSRDDGPAGLSTSAAASTEDGKWFQALDERYLLPLFSNATASRSFHARRARRSQAASPQAGASQGGSRVESDDELDDGPEVDLTAPRPTSTHHPFPPTPGVRDEVRNERGLGSPVLRGPRDSEGQSRDRVS